MRSFLGVAVSCGDALNYYILTEKEVISRSVVCPLESKDNPNLRIQPSSDVSFQVHHNVLHPLGMSPQTKVTNLPTVDPLY